MNGRKGGADAGVIVNFIARKRHIEIHAHQDAFVFEINIADSFFIHYFQVVKFIVQSSRLI